MSVNDLPDEPREMGAVIRVHNPHGKYPEIWVASNINIGSCLCRGLNRGTEHDFPDCPGGRVAAWDLDPAAVAANFAHSSQGEGGDPR
jgi:hypothetical protein